MNFQVIYDFLIQNWLTILSIILSLVYLIVFLTKKKVKETEYCSVLLLLPGWIIEAEKCGLSGSEKLTYVFSKAIQELVRLTGKDSKVVMEKYGDSIIQDVEAILSTPQKKDAN